MVDKLKQIAETAKNVLLYILTPILFVGGYIYYLTMKNQALEDKLEQTQAQAKVQKIEDQEEGAKNEADQAEADYDTLKREYLEQSGEGGSEGNVQAGDTSSGSGDRKA